MEDSKAPNQEDCLPVTCGNQAGLLHLRLFLCPGIHQECIQVNGQLVTPKMFSVMGDKEKLKDWKNAIRIRGVSVRKMMDTGDLNYYNHKDLCSGKCVSRNMGGSKYDISRFERDHEIPSFQPLISSDLCTPKVGFGNFGTLGANLGALGALSGDLDEGKVVRVCGVNQNSQISQPVFPMATAVASTPSVSPSPNPPPSEPLNIQTDAEAVLTDNPSLKREVTQSPSNPLAPASVAASSPVPISAKLSGAAKRKCKISRRKRTLACSNSDSGKDDSRPLMMSNPLTNESYLQQALHGLLDLQNLRKESFPYSEVTKHTLPAEKEAPTDNKREPFVYADDLTAKSALIAKAVVAKTLSGISYLNGHSLYPGFNGLTRNGLSPAKNEFYLSSNGVTNGVNVGLNGVTTPACLEDYLISLDLKEECQEFWRGIVELGLINDFFREIKNSLDVLKNDLIKGRAQLDDAQKVSRIVGELGLMTKLKWKLAAKRTDGERHKEGTVDMEGVKTKVEGHARQYMGQAECMDGLAELGRLQVPGCLLRSLYEGTSASSGPSSGPSSLASENEDSEEPQDLSCHGRSDPESLPVPEAEDLVDLTSRVQSDSEVQEQIDILAKPNPVSHLNPERSKDPMPFENSMDNKVRVDSECCENLSKENMTCEAESIISKGHCQEGPRCPEGQKLEQETAHSYRSQHFNGKLESSGSPEPFTEVHSTSQGLAKGISHPKRSKNCTDPDESTPRGQKRPHEPTESKEHENGLIACKVKNVQISRKRRKNVAHKAVPFYDGGDSS